MSDTDRDKKLDDILELIQKAPALNGGFSKLSDAVEDIKKTNMKVLYELQTVKTNQDNNTRKIEEIHRSLYDPDNGLYQRVTTVITHNKQQEEKIEKIEKKTQTLKENYDELNRNIETFKQKNNVLELVAGKDLQELRSTISTKKNMMRAFWVFITTALAGVVKFLWDVVPNIF